MSNIIISYIINFGSMVLIFMLVYTMYLYIKSILTKTSHLSLEQLALLESAARYAVSYAEQMYKVDETTDRHKLAVDYMYNIVIKAGFNYVELSKIIIGMLEAQVLVLPKTHR